MVSCTCVIEATLEFKFINTIMAHIHIVSHDLAWGDGVVDHLPVFTFILMLH